MIDVQGFLLAIVPIALAPGASLTLALSNVASTGVRGSVSIIVGTGLGISVHALFVGVGMASFAAQSPVILTALHVTGMLFLGWLGGMLLYKGARSMAKDVALEHHVAGVKEAFMLNIFNAKAVLFYVTVVPLYAGTTLRGYVLLSSVHIVIMALWLLLCSYVLVRAQATWSLRIIGSTVNMVGGFWLVVIAARSLLSYAN